MQAGKVRGLGAAAEIVAYHKPSNIERPLALPMHFCSHQQKKACDC